jgi:predicted site-specific integrase-resolvase
VDQHVLNGSQTCQGNKMKQAEQDPDDTFSDLLKIITVIAITLIALGSWYLCV